MKLVAISDTHGKHIQLPKLPDGDILIHSGDCTRNAGQADLRAFLEWFESQPHKVKILIAGNHDWAFEKYEKDARQMVKRVAPSCIYLQDSGVTIEGIKFYGSPVSPRFFDWAFNRDRGAAIQKHWDLIPDDVDVLITHGPAYQTIDKIDLRNPYNVNRDPHAGCENLKETIEKRLKKLKIHIFGHLHYQGGQQLHKDGVRYYNAAVANESYQIVHSPHEIVI